MTWGVSRRLSPRRPGIGSRSVLVGFVVDTGTVTSFFPGTSVSMLSVIPPL